MPFPSPGDPPDPEIEATLPALAGEFFTTEPPGKPMMYICVVYIMYIYQYILNILTAC